MLHRYIYEIFMSHECIINCFTHGEKGLLSPLPPPLILNNFIWRRWAVEGRSCEAGLKKSYKLTRHDVGMMGREKWDRWQLPGWVVESELGPPGSWFIWGKIRPHQHSRPRGSSTVEEEELPASSFVNQGPPHPLQIKSAEVNAFMHQGVKVERRRVLMKWR